MTPLAARHCSPEHAGHRTDAAETAALLAQLPGWHLEAEAILAREFHFADYYGAIAFVNAVAWIAHGENHHPDLSVHYNRVRVQWSTHDAGGLTLNDFICAAKCQALTTGHA
jgi:4a-hydroxytetrahydrobiopterin dehydratase